MASEGFDVLRLIEHNRSCYVSSEFVQGSVLIQWLKYHPNVPKKQLFSWMYEIMRQLALFHRLRGRPCYQYVNPYSVIVSSEEKLYLLDAGAKSSEILIRKMQRKAVRENFLPPKEHIYRKASEALDIYGLGRTWQYILAVTEPDPPLTKREEQKLRKIISRCLNRQSKHAYQKIEEIQKHFPAERMKKTQFQRRSKVLAAAVILMLAAAVIKAKVYSGGFAGAGRQNAGVSDASPRGKEEKEEADDSDLLKFDMGMVCLLELEEYAKAAGYLEEISRYGADCYAAIARSLEKDTAAAESRELKEALIRAEKNIPAGREEVCLKGLIKGYTLLDTEEADEEIVRLGEIYLRLGGEKGGAKEADKEIMEAVAVSYEGMDKKREAASMYEKVLEHEDGNEKREELYMKMTLMWEGAGDREKAWECCRKGIDELQESAKLRLLYIRLQCMDTSVGREVCEETIREYIKSMPKLTALEEFKKLQREYDIRVEGEEVWVGR